VVFLEAAASGLPVIAGDSGGAPETVNPGVTGFVVDRDAALADALLRLVADPGLASAMGEAGRARVEQRYTWRSVAARFEEGLQRAIKG
jgi:phosphatidylinositol alpha-1,6-mannosyltransferase